MLTEKHRLKVDKLFILGAGASYSASKGASSVIQSKSPLDKDFCKRILSLEPQRPGWVSQSVDFIKKYWKDDKELDTFGLEQAIIRQMGHLEFIDSINKLKKRRGAISESDYLNHVSHLICFVLKAAKDAQGSPYRKFANNVFPHNLKAADQKNRIITFNYDCLLDKHILEKFLIQEVYFDKIKERSSQNNRRVIQFEHPLLIKLHGSTSWRCSAEEYFKVIDSKKYLGDEPYYIENIWHSVKGMPSPSDDESPLIMPPLPVKPLTQISIFQVLWTKACEYLHEAEEIIICGYSLPETDRLAVSLFSNFSNKRLKRIVVIDPAPSILTRWRGLLRRKGVKDVSWSYFEDFSEYVKSA